jgi:hypothetical protein
VPVASIAEIRRLAPEAPAAAPAQLTYRGGPLLANVEVFTAFWGSAWQQDPLAGQADYLNAFFDDVVESALIDQLAEYSVDSYQIGHGSRVGTTVLTTPDPGSTVTDDAIQQLLEQQIASNAAFPQPNANSLYFLYLPPGTTVSMGGSSSCQAFCGYHNNDASGPDGQIFYAVMPYPSCNGCLGSLATQDALTSTSSHELCEAITDPVPGQGWYDDANGEIGDICAWQTKQLDGYTVQLEWSNQASSCI